MKNWNLLNKVLITSVAALLAATSAFAIPKGPAESRLSDPRQMDQCAEVKPGPYAFNYSKDMGLACPSDFYVYGEYILMEAKEEGLEYAITQTDATTPTTFDLSGGNIEGPSNGHHDWEWNSGFRAGFGFYMNHDAWNLDLKWTYIHIKNDTSSTMHNDGTLIPLWLPPSVTVGQTQKTASARWKAKLNTLDLSMAKPYHVSRNFIANPFFGVRAAWIDQDYHARYGGIWATFDGAQVDSSNNYWGIGLRGGFGSEFLMGAGWSLFGNLSASLLYSKFDVTQQLALSGYAYEIDSDFYDNVPNVELVLGLSWGHFLNKNNSHIGIKVAYEFHDWFNQNQMRRFFGDSGNIAANDTVSRGDLTLNGFSFRIQIDF